MMKWVIAAGVLLLLALTVFPAAIDAWNGWHRPAQVQSIHYVPRKPDDSGIDELSASRRRIPRSSQSDR